MSIKANIEITTIEEFKALTEPKIIEIPKIIIKDKIVKQKVEVKVKVPSIICCPICGTESNLHDPTIQPQDFIGLNDVFYKVVNRTCPKCGNFFATNSNKDIL